MKGWLTNLRAGLSMSAGTSPEYAAQALRKELAQCELLRVCTPEIVAETAKAEGGAAFLTAFMDDPEWMEVFLASHPVGPEALDNLRMLWTYARPDFDNPFLKRLGTALSLAYGPSPSPYGILSRYKQTQRAWNDGLLHAGFGKLSVRLMTMAVCPGNINATGYDDMLKEVRMNASEAIYTSGLCRYSNYNPYGDWVQGDYYHKPWLYHYKGSVTYIRAVGGVCGSCSNYGDWMTVAHGVPSAIAYQPSHCAYMVKQGDEWVAANLATGIGGCSSTLDWEGVSYSPTRFLREPVESDWPAYIKATRFVWLAAAQLEQAKANKLTTTDWTRSYEAALAAQPLNYPDWIAYAKALEANPTALGDAGRIDLALRAARALRFEHQAPYAAALRILGTVLSKFQPAQRAALMLEVNREVTQGQMKYFLPYEQYMDIHLDWQFAQLGDPKLETEFFGKLLAIHYSNNPDQPWNNWVFSRLLGWGYNRFANNPATAHGYAQALADFFTARGDGVDPNYKQNLIVDSIRRASDAGQAATYHQWLDISEKLLSPQKPEALGLTPQQLAARPRIEPFPGLLLSAKGMLQLSGHSIFDNPRTYGDILDGSAPGYFDISWQYKPWAQVQFTGDVDVSGIVLVDTYDKPAQQPWALPLKVMVSADGKEWTEISRIETPAPVHRIDLMGKATRVRFVRIERDGLGKNPENCLFHMRNFLVYGRTLY